MQSFVGEKKTYVERAIAPLLLGLASLSLIPSSMQALLSSPDDGLGSFDVDAASLYAMTQAFRVFSIIILLLSGLIWAFLFAIPAGVFIWQITLGYQSREKTNNKDTMRASQRVIANV